MRCLKCGAELAEGAQFCRECGTKTEATNSLCSECGTPLKSGVKFCSKCGKRTEVILDGDITAETESVNSTQENMLLASESESAIDNNTVQVSNSIPSMSENVSDSDGILDKESMVGDTAVKNAASLGETTPKNDKTAKISVKYLVIGIVGLVITILFCTLIGKVFSNGGSKISKNSTVTESVTDSKIEMINVTDMDYPTAVKMLNDAGFTNIVSNVSNDTDESLWIVTGQSESAGRKILPDTTIELVCAMKCRLYIDLNSDFNLLFNTYDISITLDSVEIGTVANGKEFTYLAEVLSGDHELIFCKTGNTSPQATKTLTVSGDMTYSCTLIHDGSSISLKNETTESNVDMASLEVVDVTGMVLSDAVATLESIGFSNLREEPSGYIWNRDNWIVVSQGVAAGTVADKNVDFELNCISLDDYFTQTYVGKNVAEIQELAVQGGFSVRFEDANGNDLTSTIANLDDDGKKDWVATSAWRDAFVAKTAVVKMEYRGIVPETTPTTRRTEPTTRRTESTTRQTEPTTRRTESPKSVNYSTNDEETVKDGNTGIYSYKNRNGSYDIYYIIDFNEGYVYYFCDGNGDETCDRIKIDSGTLNDTVIITYHDGDDTWQMGLHFRWVRQPEHLVVEDSDHFEYDFYTTDLSKALTKRYSKTIHDY